MKSVLFDCILYQYLLQESVLISSPHEHAFMLHNKESFCADDPVANQTLARAIARRHHPHQDGSLD
jgi:hypothetical protein